MNVTEELIDLINNNERLYCLIGSMSWDEEQASQFFEDILTGMYAKWLFSSVMAHVDMKELIGAMNQIYFDSEIDEYDEEGF